MSSETQLPKPILIAGPTASGKSGLAMRLARALDGVIINADSMQVYADLRILTARPSAAEEAEVPHRLYGHVDGAESYSTGRWVRDAAAAIAKARAEGRRPIVVGGTGLYFRALTEGLSPMPEIAEEVRQRWRDTARSIGPLALHAELARRDFVMAARLQPTDPQRVTRALEVLEATGTSLADWQARPGQAVIDMSDCLALEVRIERAASRSAVDRRFDGMMAGGALDEVAALRARNLPSDLPVMRALGVAPLISHLNGEATLDAAVAQAKAETRQYLKRQTTWLKRNMKSWKCICAQLSECSTEEIVAFIET